MFTFTYNEILTNEKCFDNLYDLYITIYSMEANYRHFLKNTLEHLIIPELSDIIIKYVI